MKDSAATAERKPKRRWFQYSLRTFLLLVTGFCIWFGWLSHRTRQQRIAVQAIKEMGGGVVYDHAIDDIGSSIHETPVCDITPLAGLSNLFTLTLIQTKVDNAQVTVLRRTSPHLNISWAPTSTTGVLP